MSLAVASGGSAQLNFATPTTVPSRDAAGLVCNSPEAFAVNERHYCLDVTTYSDLKNSGGVEVDLNLKNYDQSSLTNPTAKLTWGAGLTFVSSDPSICTPPGATGQANCSFPNLPGVGPASGPGATPTSFPVKLFFSAAATVPSITFTGTGNAKESGNDNNGAANVETQTAVATMTFGTDDTRDATFALPQNTSRLELDAKTPAGAHSSVTFGPGSSPFLAKFQASTPGKCFPGIPCQLQLETSLPAPSGTFSTGNPISWTADINATNTNVLAVHYYDPVTIAASSTPKTFTTAGAGFAKCDGVIFDAPGPGGGISANQEYFVINATTIGTNTSFQVATAANGKPISFTAAGPFTGACIRIIGDQKAEKVATCTASSAGPDPTQLPALCAAKSSNTQIRVYVWDSGNGRVTY